MASIDNVFFCIINTFLSFNLKNLFLRLKFYLFHNAFIQQD